MNRIIKTAHQLAAGCGVKQPDHVDQIIGVMIRKSTDGLSERSIYSLGHQTAKRLAQKEKSTSVSLSTMLTSINKTGNPLSSAYQAG